MNEIKKMCVLLSAFLLVFSFVACDKDDQLKGSGNIIEQNREVGQFTKVESATSINVVITESSSQEVQVSADDNIVSAVTTIMQNGVLKVGLADGNYIDVTITVYIFMENLEGLENTGSGNMTASGFEDLSILEINNEGSGSLTINGSGTTLSLKNSGSGSYKGFDYVVKNCTVNNSGSGNCEINCTDELSGSNSGSGGIFYKGSPTIDISNTGSGQVVDSN